MTTITLDIDQREEAHKILSPNFPTPHLQESRKVQLINHAHVHGQMIEGYINQHVVNQPELARLVTLAVIAGLKVYFIGGPGLGKTLTGTSVADYLGLQLAYTCLNPDETPANILGRKRLKLGLQEYEEVFSPGIFLKGDIVICDEANRSSDKAQAAMIEPLNKGTITIDGERHWVSPILIFLAMGNLYEDGGTRPLISALWNRFDCVAVAEGMTYDSALSAAQKYADPRPPDPTHVMKSDSLGDTRETIFEYRLLMKELRRAVVPAVHRTAAHIAATFYDPRTWRIRTSYRTVESLIDTALALAIVRDGELPHYQHVWEAARWCLGGLDFRDESYDDAERLSKIYEKIEEAREKAPKLTRT